jgi:predicted unusual protein kinase regulating ubiquinone biosynthesis (AarF/ABC1/UbiB family)
MLGPRHLPRLASIVHLFTRYGLVDFAREQGLQALARDDSDVGDGHRESSDETAVAFRKRLVELGPAYIKLGQVLSTRQDLLPEPYIRELERLHDDVEPVPFEQIVEIVEGELGGRLSKLFDSFEPTPLGTASLGQAHAARLRRGREVVVKVQRPKIRSLLADDIAFFRELADFLTSHTASGRRVDMAGIIRQLERALADELDYRIEARNWGHFRRSLAEFPRLLVPRVIESYSTERVLTSERVRGTKVHAIPRIARTELDLHPLADELTRAYLKQITIDGVFQADPHPGNVFLVLHTDANPPTPSEIVTYGLEDAYPAPDSRLGRAEEEARGDAAPLHDTGEPRLALIDFGMTAHLSPVMRELCVRILLGLADDRGDDVADALAELGEPLDEFDRAGFQREINEVVARSYRADVAEIETGAMLYQVINAAYKHGLRLPAELTLLAKALVHLGVATRALDPSFEPTATIRDYVSEIVTHRARTRLNPRQLYKVMSESADLLSALPHRLDVITKRLATNEFAARLELPQVTVLLEGLQKVANRVFSGLVLAGLLVSSAMLLPHRRILGTGGFIIAGMVVLYMVGAIVWSDRRGRGHRPKE